MRLLEIIHLRSSGEPPEDLGAQIRKSIDASESDAEVVTVYRRKGLESDVAIHIDRSGESREGERSSLGFQLASALRAFGIVDHTLWTQL